MAKKTVWKMITVLVILITAVIAWDWCLTQMAKEPRSVTIKQLGGSAIVERLDHRISVYEGMRIKSNDKLYVTRGTGVTIDFDEKHSLYAEAGSEFEVILTEDKSNDSTQVRMERGSVLFSINKAKDTAVTFLVDTPTLSMNVKTEEGSEKALFYLTAKNENGEKKVELSTLTGCVEITSIGEPAIVKQMKDGKAVCFSITENGEVEWKEEDTTLHSFSAEALSKLEQVLNDGILLCFSKEDVNKEQDDRSMLQTSSGRVEATSPIPTPTIVVTPTPQLPTLSPTPTNRPTGTPIPTQGQTSGNGSTNTTNSSTLAASPTPTFSPTLTSAPTLSSAPTPTVSPMEQMIPKVEDSAMGNVLSSLLGQTPVVDDQDDICTYYEFTEGILLAAEPVIQAKGNKPEEILTKFIFHLIMSGVNINTIDINAPITRSEAALIIYFAAQSIEYPGSEVTITDATSYVTDLTASSVFEKKAIGYLYQEKYLNGYQVPGQTFLPKELLTPTIGTEWTQYSKDCWMEQ